MRLNRAQFTIRRMIAAIAILAVLLGIARWAYDRYVRRGIVVTYYIGDLMGVTGEMVGGGGVIPAQIYAELPRHAVLLKSSITPDVWWFGARSVNPSPVNLSLVVSHTEEGHQQVVTWLKQRRNRLNSIRRAGHKTAGQKSRR